MLPGHTILKATTKKIAHATQQQNKTTATTRKEKDQYSQTLAPTSSTTRFIEWPWFLRFDPPVADEADQAGLAGRMTEMGTARITLVIGKSATKCP